VALLLACVIACSGGSAFTTSPVGAPPDDAGNIPITVSNPNGAADATTSDATAITDAGAPPDALPDAPLLVCTNGDLACEDGCTPNDTNHCGGCNVACAAPEAGSATCQLSDAGYACRIACDESLVQCDSACVDLQSDPKNCGSCGHDCLQGACTAGQCQPWIVANVTQDVVVPGGNPAGGRAFIVTDGVNAVWFDQTYGIEEAPLVPAVGQASDAGPAPPIALSPTNDRIGQLAMANHVVAWTQAYSDPTTHLEGIGVWTAQEGVPGSMANPVSVAAHGNAASRGLALDPTGSTAYFLFEDSSSGSAALERCVFSSKSCTPVATATPAVSDDLPNDVAVSGDDVFWTDSARNSVMHLNVAAGIPTETFASGLATVGDAGLQNGPYALAVDSQYVYWGEATNDGYFSVGRGPIAGTAGTHLSTVLPPTLGDLMTMAVDSGNLYYAGISGGTYVASYTAVSGLTFPQTLATQSGIFALAASSGIVAWLDLQTNTVQAQRIP
jgi:hypothetical protein